MVVNLVDPTSGDWGWTYFGTPTLSSTGIKGNGTNAAVLSDWKMLSLTQASLGDSHWSCYIKYFGGGSGAYLNGVLDTNGLPYIKAGFGYLGGAYGGLWGDAYAFDGSFAASDYDGFIYGENLSSTTNTQFINNVGASPKTIEFREFSENQSIAMLALAWVGQTNNIYQDFSTSEIRSWSMGAGLTSTERTALYDAVVDFQTTLGRTI
jgi:hypothetical protein